MKITTEKIKEIEKAIRKPISRPVWQNNEITGHITVSLIDRDFLRSCLECKINWSKEGFYIGFAFEELNNRSTILEYQTYQYSEYTKNTSRISSVT